MQSTRRPRWQQATALVSLSTAGAMTGLAFAHGTAADLTSPSAIPIRLLASDHEGRSCGGGDAALRAAIVKSAQYYLRLAQTRTPAEMEALIWQNDSLDGADHGESCAAFASLMLESGAQATGQQSWVTGGSTYPGRCTNGSTLASTPIRPHWASPRSCRTPRLMAGGIRSATVIPRSPGDWVLFDEHVEVVTNYADGVLYTIGGDSGSNLSVNAHQYDGPLAACGRARLRQQRRAGQRGEPGSGSTQASPSGAGRGRRQATRRRRAGNWPPLPRARPACRGW